MTRISTNTLTMNWLSATNRGQAELLRTQLQVATGRRFNTPADDPDGAVRALGLERSLDRISTHQDNADAAMSRLSLEEQVLGGVTDVLQRVRELAIQAGGPGLDDVSRRSIAAEIRELHDSLLQLANSDDGRGEYLFSGNRVRTVPFAPAGGQIAYNGDEGRRLLEIGETRSIEDGDAGRSVFLDIANGNGTFKVAADDANGGTGLIGVAVVQDAQLWNGGSHVLRFADASNWEVVDGAGTVVAAGPYADGELISFSGIAVEISGSPVAGDVFDITPSSAQDLFSTLQTLANTLETPATVPVGRTALLNDLGNGLQDIDRGLEHLSRVRATVGSRLNTVEAQKSFNDSVGLELESALSAIRDVDYAEALSQLEARLFGLEAAQKAYLEARQLSLFRFI